MGRDSTHGAFGNPTRHRASSAIPRGKNACIANAYGTVDPTKVVGRRIVAYLIDALIISASGVGTFFATVTLTQVPFCSTSLDGLSAGSCFRVNGTYYALSDISQVRPSQAVFGGAAIFMFVILQGLTGASVGKFFTGIRVVREDGRACGVLKALVRQLLWIIDGIGCCVVNVAVLTALMSTGHRRVGDMVAKTYVVRSSAKGRPVRFGAATTDPWRPVS